MRPNLKPRFGAALFVLLFLLLSAFSSAQGGPPGIKYTVAGNANTINSIVIAPNNLYFASGCNDSTVKLWNMADGTLLHTCSFHLPVGSLAISPDSQTVVSLCGGSKVVLWNAADGSENSEIPVPLAYCLALSPDGTQIAVGGGDGNVYLYSAASGNLMTTLSGHTNSVASVAFAPTNGSMLVSGSADNTARVWNLSTNTSTVLSGHTGPVNAVAFSPIDSSTIVTGSQDATARLWRIKSGVSSVTLSGHTNQVYSVAFTPNAKTVLTGSQDGTVKAWNTATATLSNTFVPKGEGITWALASLSDNASFLSAGYNRQIYQFRIADRSLVRTIGGNYGSPVSVLPAPNGLEMATNINRPASWRQNVADGSFLQDLGSFQVVAYSQDSQFVVLGGGGQALRIRKIASGKTIRTFPTTGIAAFQLDGKSLVTYDGTSLKWWGILDGGSLKSISLPSGNRTGTAVFTVDGTKLALGDSSGAIYIYRVSDGTLLQTLKASGLGDISQIVWSTDATTLAASSNNNVTVFRVLDGSVQGSYSPPPGISYGPMALSPFGDVVSIYRNEDFALETWHIFANQETYFDQEFANGVVQMVFSTDASVLFVSRSDATLMALYNPYPVSLASVAVNPTTVQGGLLNPTGTVTMNQPTPVGGANVQLTVSDPTLIKVPSSVLVARGDTMATFTVTTNPVTTNKTVTIWATYQGRTTPTTLNIEPNTAPQSITVTPSVVTGGFVSTGVVTLAAKAGATGIVVPLTSSDPTVTVPATVTIPPFKKNVLFLIRTAAVTAKTVVTISGTHGGVTQSATITLMPFAVAAVTLIPSTISGGDDAIGIVTLNAPAPTNTIVTLTTSAPNSAAPVSSTITIPSGSQTGSFYILSNPVTATKKVIISAQKNGTATATLTLTP